LGGVWENRGIFGIIGIHMSESKEMQNVGKNNQDKLNRPSYDGMESFKEKAKIRQAQNLRHDEEEQKEREIAEKEISAKLDELTQEDLAEDEKETYDILDSDLQKKYLIHVAKERKLKNAGVQEKAEEKQFEEVAAIPLLTNYGVQEYSDFKNDALELIPTLKNRFESLRIAMELTSHVYDKPQEVPENIWKKVDDIFDRIPNSAQLKLWNRKQVQEGRYGHIAAYLLQDFRNSPEAKKLNQMYTKLSKKGREELEKNLRAQMPDGATYDFMFRVGMKPFCFSPLENPEYKSEKRKWSEGEFTTTYDSSGIVVYTGIDKYNTHGIWESDVSYTNDEKGRKAFFGQYYGNTQPNFLFHRYDNEGRDNGYVFFKTYLGAKGMMLWYEDKIVKEGEAAGNNVDEIYLTDEQMIALQKFFRWERGDVGDNLIKEQYEKRRRNIELRQNNSKQ
jgi:hypothetical protein